MKWHLFCVELELSLQIKFYLYRRTQYSHTPLLQTIYPDQWASFRQRLGLSGGGFYTFNLFPNVTNIGDNGNLLIDRAEARKVSEDFGV